MAACLQAAAFSPSPTNLATMNPITELTQLLSPLFALFGENAWLRALTVLMIGFLAALIIDRLIIRMLKRISHKTSSPLDDQLVAFLSGPLFQSIVLLTVATAATVLKVSETLQGTLNALLQSYAVLIWSLFLGRFARSVLRRMALNPTRFALLRNQTLPLFDNIAIVLIVGLAIYLIFSAWHIDMTAWLASAGIIGIAVGLPPRTPSPTCFRRIYPRRCPLQDRRLYCARLGRTWRSDPHWHPQHPHPHPR